MRDEHITTETLVDYLHHELAVEDDARVLAHIGECAACRAAYHAQAQLTDRLRAFALAEERDLPPRVVFGVRERLARRTHPAWWRRLAPARAVVGLPVAAAVVLAVLFGFSSIRPNLSHAPSIAAAYYLDDHTALSNRLMPLSQAAAVPVTLTNPETSQNANVAAGGDSARIDARMIASE